MVRAVPAVLALLALLRPLDAGAGCGTVPERVPQTVTADGRERGVIVAVPEPYRADIPHALVVAFHGRTNGNERVRRYFDLEENAEAPTVFVYPAALTDRTGRFVWDVPGDVRLFDRIVETMADALCIDLDRVHVVGHSLGASFANTLACRRGDAIRGVATVGGGLLAAGECEGAVAAMVLHNPRDAQVPLAEGLRVRNAFLRQNGLDRGSEPVPRSSPLRRFNCRCYGPDTADHPVLWCPHRIDRTAGGRVYPHQWPSGTGAAIMDFFARLPPADAAVASEGQP